MPSASPCIPFHARQFFVGKLARITDVLPNGWVIQRVIPSGLPGITARVGVHGLSRVDANTCSDEELRLIAAHQLTWRGE